MGFLSGLADTFGFGDGGANDAANQIQAANASAQKKLDAAFGTTETSLQPFADAGANALPGLEAGSTVGGLDETLRNIFDSDIFKSLLGERTRAVEGQLGASGQLRSGAGLLEAARVPTELGLMIEQLLNSRLQGLTGQGLNTSLDIGKFRAANATGNSNLIANTGFIQAQGILGGRANQAAGVNNLFGTITGGVTGVNEAGGIKKILAGLP